MYPRRTGRGVRGGSCPPPPNSGSLSTSIRAEVKKGKGSFDIAQYQVRWTAQSASHFLPSLTDLFIPTPCSASPGSILARQQLRAKTKSLTFPPLSIGGENESILGHIGGYIFFHQCDNHEKRPRLAHTPGKTLG